MNSRSYHRNSVMAFPKTAAYGCAIERPAKRIADKVVGWTLALGVLWVVVILVLENWK